MSKRRKNAGLGYGYQFHGSFKDKKDAVAKERKTKGAWIKSTLTNAGYRHIVMSPRTNPRKASRRTNYESGYFSERHGDGSLGIVVWANTQAGPFHVQPYVNNWDTATHEVGKYKTLEMARKKARAYLEREGRYRRGNANPSELLVMGANPHSHEITAKPGETITIRVNPSPATPRPNLYLGFGPSEPSRKELATSRRQFKASVRQKTKEERTELSRLRRSARSGFRSKRKLQDLFHEVYGANPGASICGAKIGGEVCTRKPGHRGPHLPQGATMRTRERLPHSWKPRANPSAAALREAFTGADADSYTVHSEAHMPAGDYAQLGKLLALYVKPHSGGQVQMIKPRGAILVSDESARQLWFVGGDQDIAAALGVFGARQRSAGLFELGEAERIDYKQRKEHVPDPDVDEWRHEFGEESGVRPVVLFDATHKRLLLEGGEYVVRAEGIVN